MEAIAIHRSARISPQKVRRYRQLIKGRSVAAAEAQLRFLPGKAPQLLIEVLRSAVANATHNLKLNSALLVVVDVIIDNSFTFKRIQPVSRGMAHPILKRTAHIAVIVEEAAVGRAPAATSANTLPEATPHAKKARQVMTGKVSEAKPSLPARSQTASLHDKSYEATQKMRMAQQGGNPKKTHRRKDKGG